MFINDSDQPPDSSTAMAAINTHNTETKCNIHYSNFFLKFIQN